MKSKIIASAIALLAASPFSYADKAPTVYFSTENNLGVIESKDQFLDKYDDKIHRYTEMEEILERSEDDGESAFLMSKLHHYGIYFDKDENKAVEYARMAADLKYEPAVNWYRTLRFSKGIEVPMSEWRKYAFKGDPVAQYVVAKSYLEPGVMFDYDIALFLLSRSSDSGFKASEELKNRIVELRKAEMSLAERKEEAQKGSLVGLKLVEEAYSKGLIVEPNARKSLVLKQFISDLEMEMEKQ